MGMVRAVQKGDMEPPSPEIAKVADSMKKKDVKDFAGTKHKGLPEKKPKKKINEEVIYENIESVKTIQDVLNIIKIARNKETSKNTKSTVVDVAKNLGLVALGVFSGGSTTAAAGAAGAVGLIASLKDLYNSAKTKKLKPDFVEDFPILDMLKMDYWFIETLEDDHLKEIDEDYEEYLRTLDPKTELRKVIPINRYVTRYIYKKTDGNILIKKSKGKK